MRNKLLIVLMLCIIICCQQKPVKKEYYQNGKLHFEKFQIGTNDSMVKEYYQTGILKSEYQTYNHNDSAEYNFYKENGILFRLSKYKKNVYSYSIDYYNNGKIKSIGKYDDGFPHGWFTYYKQNGLLESRKEIFTLQDSSIAVNQEIYFNEKGDTLKEKSNYFSLHTNKDTISLGEDYAMGVKLDAPFFKRRMQVIVEDIDDTSMATVYNAKNFMVNISVKPKKRGKQVLSGRIIDFYYLENGEKPRTKYYNKKTNSEGRSLFFDKEFFVK